MIMNKLHLKITGRVQGVWFRSFVKETAELLGITGYSRNLPDGSVEVKAYGEKEVLDKFLIKCEQGPQHAKVDNIQTIWSEVKITPDSFEVRY